MRRKSLVLCICCSILLACGCRKTDDQHEDQHDEQQDASTVVSAFFDGNYTYEKITYNGDQVTSVIEGEIINSPYVEYQKRTGGEGTSLWEEMYCCGEGDVVNTYIKTNGTWENSVMKVARPYGYGEDLQLEYVEEVENDGGVLELYETDYTVELGKNFLEEELTAAVSQTYYLDMENECVVRVDTDLTELQCFTAVLNDVLTSGKDLDEAMQDAEDQGNIIQKEELYVSDFGEVENITDPR